MRLAIVVANISANSTFALLIHRQRVCVDLFARTDDAHVIQSLHIPARTGIRRAYRSYFGSGERLKTCGAHEAEIGGVQAESLNRIGWPSTYPMSGCAYMGRKAVPDHFGAAVRSAPCNWLPAMTAAIASHTAGNSGI